MRSGNWHDESLRGKAWLAAALLALAGAGCRSLDAKVHNLRELHHEDGKVSYRAALMGDVEYSLRSTFHVSAPLGLELDFQDKEPELVKNPARKCLQNLLAFSAGRDSSERVRALAVEIYAWLATGDSYVLARERSLIELGPLARELGVREPLELSEDAPPPGVDELAQRISDLVAAARPVLAGRSDDSARAAFAAACDALARLEHDVQTGRRVLRTAAALLGADGAERRAFEPLRVAAHDVGWRVASLALTRALSDPHPLVRAAAVDAWVTATDNGAAKVVSDALFDTSPIVVHRALVAVAEHGIPARGGEDPEGWRESWLAAIVGLSAQSSDSAVGAAACRALGRVSNAGFETLRFDEWVTWWRARKDARLEEPDVLAPQAKAGS